ncbi:MaoC/PaaZ C-terminal domain-containing protein [Sphingosinicella microcystinivorans]|uniref:MaoC/PaaZ C-terminal domain-containing protein n=1 Tax=Sphingosinicella microcystinivorans TaxID=335406 RepID=UPI0022F3AAA8|nr:MaoC/PaaZ C-terminal domain-containing protein [Sphingosinicella microcystinivorans]WBX83833.1 MaoC/PaaZ C-terminal domain-containing protein [Sphingosinicella microcystinivorans]
MPLNYDALVGARFAPQRQLYSAHESILYALSLGVGAIRPNDLDELRYVYERGLSALPTMALTLAPPISWLSDPSFGITYKRIVHAEQYLELHRPLPAQGGVISEAWIDGVFDKGANSGAIVHLARRLLDEQNGELLASMTYVLFMLDDGGFGGVEERPERLFSVGTGRPCDLQISLPTSPNQALLYRLTGDMHPLHIDPEVAASAGFGRPILHGLCAYGMVGRAAVQRLCHNDPSRLVSLDTRFTNPVFPGEPLELQIWHEEPGHASFRLLASSRGVVVQDRGRVGFRP